MRTCCLQVLNAMLLACASDHNNGDKKPSVALRAMGKLLEAGAVADTWAPNGSSVSSLGCATVMHHPTYKLYNSKRRCSSSVLTHTLTYSDLIVSV